MRRREEGTEGEEIPRTKGRFDRDDTGILGHDVESPRPCHLVDMCLVSCQHGQVNIP